MGLFHVNIYRMYLAFLTVCDHQKLRFFNSNNNTAVIVLTTTTANTNSNNKETIIHCFLENHASIVVINLLGFCQDKIMGQYSFSFSQDRHIQLCSLAASLLFSSTPLMRPNPG